MQHRKLGNTGIDVAPLTFGGNVFGWTIDERTSFTLLDAFAGGGFNLIDTADVYSRWVPGNKGGESESIIGNWMKHRGNRNRMIIATKVGADMGQGQILSRPYIIKAVENSLERLRTDYIDVYQSHYNDRLTPVEETLEAYDELVKQGKVRWIGASNFSPARLKESLEASKKHGFPSYQTFQPEYNIYAREEFEKETEKICLDNHIGVISYFSLAAGFLTGKYRNEADLSKSVRGQGIKKYMNEKGFNILMALDDVASQYKTTTASVALAWLMARPSVTAPIASATSIEQLDELMRSASLQLDLQSVDLIDKASAWKP